MIDSALPKLTARLLLLLVSSPLVAVIAAGCGSATATGWGCVKTVKSGKTRCVCADPAPAGDAIDPAECNYETAGLWCCHDGKTCKCGSHDECDGIPWVENCMFAGECPGSYDDRMPAICNNPDLSCPYTGNEDPECSEFSCSCDSDGIFRCGQECA